MINRLLLTALLALSSSATTFGQTTAFTYQARLSDNNGNPLTGHYDFQFKLFDTATVGSGTQQGAMVPVSNITATAGIFTVQIDFGACDSCFNGSARFLEIAVKANGGAGFTTLSPRQSVSSTPYAIKAQNLTFNGPYDNGVGSSFTATNTFAGEGAGLNTAPDPAVNNSLGKFNAFYGAGAGKANTTGQFNAFFGSQAGHSTTSPWNSFFGHQAGFSNTTGDSNAFFGYQAGQNSTTGNFNTFFGNSAGINNSGGTGNTFVGYAAYLNNTPAGDENTLLGIATRVNSGVNNGTALGARARVTQSNSLILGSISGINGATADTNVGIGTTAPSQRLHVVGNSLFTGNLTVNGTINGGLPSGSGNYIQNATTPQAANFNISGNGVVGGSLGVGVATNPPVDTLQVVKGTADLRFGTPNGADGMEIRSSSVGHSPAIYLTNTGTQGRSYRIASYGDHTNPGSFVIRDETAGTDRLTISSTGEFKIRYPGFGRGVLSFEDSFVLGQFSGLSSEAANMLLNIGVNTGREGTFNPSFPGFFLRTDTRTGTMGFHFSKKAVTSGIESELVTINELGNVGIGATAPFDKLEVSGTGVVRARINSDSNAGIGLALSNQPKWSVATTTGGNFQIFNDAIGQNALAIDTSNNVVAVSALGSAGSTQLCRNGSNEIATCSSGLRYKTNIKALHTGLSLIERLRPVTFNWKQSGEPDLGLVAEEVAKVEPLLVTHNDKGEIEGVKYDRLSVAFINAFKEQQAQIDQQQKRIDEQQQLIEALRILACQINPQAPLCK